MASYSEVVQEAWSMTPLNPQTCFNGIQGRSRLTLDSCESVKTMGARLLAAAFPSGLGSTRRCDWFYDGLAHLLSYRADKFISVAQANSRRP